MGIERILNLLVTRRTGAQGLTSQNYPVILSDETPTESFGDTNRTKRYSVNATGTVATDWGPNSETYKAFFAMSKMARKPRYIYVAKRSAPIATVVELAFDDDLATGQTVTGSVNGETISVLYATSPAATLTAIAAAIADVEGVATAVSDGVDTITITGTANWVLNVGTFTSSTGGPGIEKTTVTAGRNITSDIVEMFAEQKAPYLIYLTSAAKGTILAAAPYVQTLKKLLFVQTTDADVPTAATNDVASLLKAQDLYNTAIFFTKDSTKHYAAGLAALCLSYPAGKVAFHNKELEGIAPDELTDDEIGYLEEKNCNNYAEVYGDTALLLPGVTVDGVQIHATRDQHYFISQLEAEIAHVLKSNPKLSLNRAGLLVPGIAGQGVMNRMVDEDVFDEDVPAILNTPDPDDISPTDKSANHASGYTGSAKIENAMVRISVNLDLQL